MPTMSHLQMEKMIRQQAAEIGQLQALAEKNLAERLVLLAERDEIRKERDALQLMLAELRQRHGDDKRTMASLVASLQNAEEVIKRQVRREFGAASERSCSDQSYIAEVCAFRQAEEAAAADASTEDTRDPQENASATATDAAVPADKQEKKKKKRPPTAGGRNPLPENIERRTVNYTPPADHPALKLAINFTQIDTKAIEQWSIGKVDLHIKVMICPLVNIELPGGIITQALLTPPSIISRGQVNDDVLVQSVVDKVVDHLPSHRQEQRLVRLGALIPRSKLCRWHIATAVFLQVIAAAIFDEIISSPVIGIDDTIHRLLVPELTTCKNARIWTVSSPSGLYYLFTQTREGKWINDLLGNYRGGVMGDAYAGHNQLLGTPGIKALFCWAHVRRKFHEADDPQRRAKMIHLIEKLYGIEKELKESTPEERVFTRGVKARPILDQIKAILDEWHNDPHILPKSGIGMAVSYALNIWTGLERYTTIGHAPIDNNATERGIRPIALHRKNSLFSASEAGAESYATLLTITRTALLHHLDPVAYLNEVIEDLHFGRRSASELTPMAYARRLGSKIKSAS